MVKMVAPTYANLGMHLIISYSPKEEKVSTWHIVRDGRTENLQTIATKYGVPVTTLIEFNFPGSVKNGCVNPDIVNWYLFNHQRFRCRVTTQNGMNYMFQGGEKVAIPYLGQVEIGEPEIIRSRNTKFKIRMHANLNASIVVGADFSIFEIWDENAGLSSFYTYWAGGVTGGIKGGPWLSATSKGPWNDFVVTKAIGANEFSGPTRFTTGGGGSLSKNYINFMGLPLGTQTLPNPLPINTGFTFGIGAGTSVGTMQLFKAGEPDGLLPFKGP
jgi:hypothetical protein